MAARFGRAILELGGNNAMIVAPSADLDMAVRAILFSAVGTAGQRCTSLQASHRPSLDPRGDLTHRLVKAYSSLPIGDPREAGTLVGPLIDHAALDRMTAALARAKDEGGRVHGGGRDDFGRARAAAPMRGPRSSRCPGRAESCARRPSPPSSTRWATIRSKRRSSCKTTFRRGCRRASSRSNVREAETFLSATGSDCGIANVNIGPSGAEIGGAFGGEKETGGGRESGSDAWKSYMRRQTSTVNYSAKLPLAQGVRFDV